MNQRFVGMVVLAVAAVTPCTAYAQSTADFAGYTGLLGSPTGAFTPMNNVLGLPEAKGSPAFAARYARWSVDPRSTTTNFGVGLTAQHNSLATTFEFGYSTVSGCGSCNELMGGIDMQLPLVKSPPGTGSGLQVGLNPALGIGRTTGGDLHETLLSAAVSLPMALSFGVGQHGVFVPFVSPGFGVGHVSFPDESFTGTRAMLGGGATLANADWPLRVTASVRKIFISRSPTIVGLGLSVIP